MRSMRSLCRTRRPLWEMPGSWNFCRRAIELIWNKFMIRLTALKESWTWMMWMVENSNFSHFLLFPSRSIDMFFPFNFWKYHIEVKHYHRITLKNMFL
jgi:hypothetical protein